MSRPPRTRHTRPGCSSGGSDGNDTRRASVLATLYFAPACTATLRELLRDMENVLDKPMSAERMRRDLAWLAQAGLVRVASDTAQITERGRDVARHTAPWPAQGSSDPSDDRTDQAKG